MSKQQRAPGALEQVRAFVNTLDLEDVGREQLATPRQLAVWLKAHVQAHDERALKPSEAEFRRAIELREAMRKILLAHNATDPPPPEAYDTLDAVAQRARLQLRFGRDGASSLRATAGGVDGALGKLLAIVHHAARDGTWERLKACRDERCQWAFYDNTKNRSGTWCEMETCGNRAKARAYRRRSTSEAA